VPADDTGRQWRPRFSDPSGEFQKIYRKGEQTVGVYIAYYRNQNAQRKLVSSENVLVTSDDHSWARISGGTRDADFHGDPVTVRTTELRGANGRVMTVWQWYWINGRLTSSDVRAKGYTALSRLAGQGDDSAVIIVYAGDQQPGGAPAALESFVRASAPASETALHDARAAR
jgi:EpsI family protein